MNHYVTAPFTIVVDTREQHPYHFMGVRADARQQYRPLIVPVVTDGLKTGDYSLLGYENEIAMERKSKADIYACCCAEKERFERELVRLSALPGWSGVVVESSFEDCYHNPPPHTRYSRKSFCRQIWAWQIKHRNIQWTFAKTRFWAERATLRLLARYYSVMN